jgi:hypothetical protein
VTHAGKTGNRGHVDNAAPSALQHLNAEIAAREKRPEKIDRHDALPLRRTGLFCRHNEADTGIVHQAIQGAVIAPDSLSEPGDKFFRGNIARNGACLETPFAQPRRLGFSRLNIDQDDPAAALCQQGCGSQSEALRRAGDEDCVRHRRHCSSGFDCISKQICTA